MARGTNACKISETNLDRLKRELRIKTNCLLEMKAKGLIYKMRIDRALETAIKGQKFLKTDFALFAPARLASILTVLPFPNSW